MGGGRGDLSNAGESCSAWVMAPAPPPSLPALPASVGAAPVHACWAGPAPGAAPSSSSELSPIAAQTPRSPCWPTTMIVSCSSPSSACPAGGCTARGPTPCTRLSPAAAAPPHLLPPARPCRYRDIWEFYKKAEASFWTGAFEYCGAAGERRPTAQLSLSARRRGATPPGGRPQAGSPGILATPAAFSVVHVCWLLVTAGWCANRRRRLCHRHAAAAAPHFKPAHWVPGRACSPLYLPRGAPPCQRCPLPPPRPPLAPYRLPLPPLYRLYRLLQPRRWTWAATPRTGRSSTTARSTL